MSNTYQKSRWSHKTFRGSAEGIYQIKRMKRDLEDVRAGLKTIADIAYKYECTPRFVNRVRRGDCYADIRPLAYR